MPRISILLSVCNGERYLRSAIESLLAQTYRDFELLVVDDGSNDQTSAILREESQRDARVRVITNPTNLGLTRSLNIALAQAQGAYIARMDADDIARPDRLEKQVAFLDAHMDVGLVGSAYQFIDGAGDVIGERHPPTTDRELRRALPRTNPLLHSSVMMRKELLDRVHDYDENYHRAQDYDLWMRVAPLTALANLPYVLMQKRFTTGMISYAREREQIRCALRVRWRAIRRGSYPYWCLIFLVKPLVATLLPASVVRRVRIHLFGQSQYKQATKKM
ncbi:glycosyltransferase [Candidatus Uhrbacteria bacterium]|nr:glycosyltransferase [Candidatus Uhrbacteria bacterium]